MKFKTLIILVVVIALGYWGLVSIKKNPEGGDTQNNVNTGPAYYKDLVRVDTPKPGSKVNNNVTVRGAARGNWYFEGSFPIRIVDAEGRVLAEGAAEAQTEWMTTDYVPFIANLQIGKVQIAEGAPLRVIILKDNPSGLPQNDDSTSFGVVYTATAVGVNE